jgi:lysophospholipase
MLGTMIQSPTTGWSQWAFRFNSNADFCRGRALSYQFVNATEGGPAFTWSSIALQQEFIDGKMPMPIVVADEREPDQLAIGK